MTTLEWKKVITLQTQQGKQVTIDVYTNSMDINLPNGDCIEIEEDLFELFVSLITENN